MDTATLKASANELCDRVRPKIDEAKEELGRINGRLTGFIKDHPAVCLFGALALGYVVARLARHQH
jgi:hypothetical protein